MTTMLFTLATHVVARNPNWQQELQAIAEMDLEDELLDQLNVDPEADVIDEQPLAIYHELVPAKYLESDDFDGIEIFHEGATTIQLHLRQEGLAGCPGVDLVVESADGLERHVYDGEDFHEAGCEDEECFRLNAMSVEGDAVRVFWEGPTEGCEDLRVMVDGYHADDEALRRRTEESQCGNRYDWMDRECAKKDFPQEYEASQPIGVMYPMGCTVWKIKGNYILTNAHCCKQWRRGAGMFYDETTGDTSDKRWGGCHHTNSEIWFNYEKNGCNASGRKKRVKVMVDKTLYFMKSKTSGADFSLLTTKDEKTASTFGFVEIDTTPPKVGDVMWIAGQPRALEKKLSLYDTGIDGKRRVCKVNYVSPRQTFNYNCDTTGGNSGSPVLRTNRKNLPTAFGIHQAAGCSTRHNNANGGNTGTKASYFMPILKPFLAYRIQKDACASGTFISSADQCKAAAKGLKLKWNGCCQNNRNLPYGCLNRKSDGDVIWNGNRNTPNKFPCSVRGNCDHGMRYAVCDMSKDKNPQYAKSDHHSSLCRPGYVPITQTSECWRAYHAVGLGHLMPSRSIQFGEWSHVPTGCSWQDGRGTGGDDAPHFNKHKSGKDTAGHYTTICKYGKKQPVYAASPHHDSNCKPGYKRITNANECLKAYKAVNVASSKRGLQTGHWHWVPTGCSWQDGWGTHGDDAPHFNSHSNGRDISGHYTAICKLGGSHESMSAEQTGADDHEEGFFFLRG